MVNTAAFCRLDGIKIEDGSIAVLPYLGGEYSARQAPRAVMVIGSACCQFQFVTSCDSRGQLLPFLGRSLSRTIWAKACRSRTAGRVRNPMQSRLTLLPGRKPGRAIAGPTNRSNPARGRTDERRPWD